MELLLQQYIQTVESWGVAMEEGDPKKANALYETIQQQYKLIKDSGLEEQLFAIGLDSSDIIRFVVASHIKVCNAERASRIYETLVDSRFPFVAVSAKYILREIRRSV